MTLRNLPAVVSLSVCVAVMSVDTAFAQASRLGGSFSVTGASPTGARRPDVEYDTRNDVYLVVAQNEIYGRFVSGDGAPLGGGIFKIPQAGTHTQSSRLAYSPDLPGFLVTWLDTRVNGPEGPPQVWGRLVAYTAGGSPTFLSGDFMISPAPGGVHPEMAPSVAYAGSSKEFLVTWMQGGGGAANDIRAQRLNNAGQPLGGEIVLTFDNHWSGDPSVVYNPVTDEFLITYRNYTEPNGPAEMRGRRVKAGTGAVSDVMSFGSGGYVGVTETQVNPSTGEWMVAWYQSLGGRAVFYGQLVGPDGAKRGGVRELVVNYPSYDGFDLSYNSLSNTYFAIYHGRADSENWGQQVTSSGSPEVEFQVTATGARNGNFNPRLSAHAGRAEWLVVTANDFSSVVGQRVQSTGSPGGPPAPPPPPPPPPPGPTPATVDLSPANAPNGSWFFAEGIVGSSRVPFDTFYLLLNDSSAPISVRAYYARENGDAFETVYTVPANSRRTISLRQDMGNGAASAVFQSLTAGADVFVERTVTWGTNLEGSTSVMATKQLGTEWYFAEGSRRYEFFDNYYMLFNPNQTAATVTATFYLPSGQTTTRTVTVGRQQRVTMGARDLAELAGNDFSARFSSDTPLVVERAMYWGPDWMGGTGSMGAPRLNNYWFFAEGAAAPGFHTYYTLMNPNPQPVSLAIEYRTEYYGVARNVYQLAANSRSTIYLNAVVGNIGGVSTFMATEGGEPILAERSVYWGQSGWVEGHNVVGASAWSREWRFPDGSTAAAFETYLLLQNPHPRNVPVNVIVYMDGGGRYTPASPVVIPPLARLTVNMAQLLGQLEGAEGLAPGTLVGKSFAVKVVAVDPNDPIVAEHALYWQRDGANYWRGGTASFGIVP